jgi:hypothetical protein
MRGARGEVQDGGSAWAATTHGPGDRSRPRHASPAGSQRGWRATACSGRQRPKTIQTSTLRSRFAPNFPTEVDQVDNRKVVDLIPLYNFYKGRMGFFSTIFAQELCQVGSFLGAGE